MSWSLSIIGKPEKVAEELDRQSAIFTGQSKEEFDAALPHLKVLVLQNVGDNLIVQLSANGHATIADGKRTYGTVYVNLTQLFGNICL